MFKLEWIRVSVLVVVWVGRFLGLNVGVCVCGGLVCRLWVPRGVVWLLGVGCASCCGFEIIVTVLCRSGYIMYTMHGLLPSRFACLQRGLVD